MLLLAHLLPLGFGVAAYAALVERPRDAGGGLRALGYGYVIGIAVAALAVATFAPAPTRGFSVVALPLAAGATCLAIAAWLRMGGAPSRPIAPDANPRDTSAWTYWLVVALLAWIALRGSSLAMEAGSRAVFPWDAFSTWCVKARTWFLADEWLAFAGTDAWPDDASRRFIAAAHYPDGISYVQLWFAGAVGAWNESAIFSFWPACWLAGMAILAGQLRALHVPWSLCAVAVYAWGSLPLVQTHVALPGYVDLPMTVMFGAAALSAARAVDEASLRHGALALVLVSCLPGLKHEGALWLFVIALAAGLGWLAVLHRLRWVGGIVVLLLLAWLVTGVRMWLPGLGWIDARWGALHVPALSISFALEWRPVHREVIGSLLFGPNWHLLWWLAPVLAVATRRHWYRARVLGMAVALAMAGVFVVFFFTDASAWAEDLTAVNRVLMHVTLALVAWLACVASAACEGGIASHASGHRLRGSTQAPAA